MRCWPTAFFSGASALACALPLLAYAQDFQLHGFADLRAVSAANETSFTHGGLGKTRYGGDDGLRFGGAALRATWQFAPAWLAVADVRLQPQYRATVGLTEAFVRYRPVSTDAWRWSFKAGAFFPPISLENDGVGWTSRWMLTPSALNTWVGEELRTFGAEARLEHRSEHGTFEFAGALFAANDPAGEILFARGWSLSDMVSGVGTRLREPDVYARMLDVEPPRRYDPFLEIDHRVGYYINATWRAPQFGRVTALFYDNRADPSAYRTTGYEDELFAWHTRFSSFGMQTNFGNVELLGQALAGSTEIAPSGFRVEAHFTAAYVLASWNLGAWRPALRVDAFTTREDPAFPPALSEHGNALTLALNWRPQDWLRITGETVRVDSVRDQRLALNAMPRRIDTQMLLNARILF